MTESNAETLFQSLCSKSTLNLPHAVFSIVLYQIKPTEIETLIILIYKNGNLWSFHLQCESKTQAWDFPDGLVVKNPPASTIYNSQHMEAT